MLKIWENIRNFTGNDLCITVSFKKRLCIYQKFLTLYHEIFDNSVKGCIFETKWYSIPFSFSCTKLSEIFGCSWYQIEIKFHKNSTNICITDPDVKKYNRIVRVSQLSLNLGPAMKVRHVSADFKDNLT